jgi:hypothetical protein
MKLYVCWGTFRSPRPGGHPCGNAYRALQDAGYEPEVEKVYGLGLLPDALNPSGRKKLKKMTGSSWAPVLETDEGEVIAGSNEIAAWAQGHPAGAAVAAA